jgi:hypothetical protein
MVDYLAGVRLRHVVRLGSPRKAAQVHNVAEDFEESQVHFRGEVFAIDGKNDAGRFRPVDSKTSGRNGLSCAPGDVPGGSEINRRGVSRVRLTNY